MIRDPKRFADMVSGARTNEMDEEGRSYAFSQGRNRMCCHHTDQNSNSKSKNIIQPEHKGRAVNSNIILETHEPGLRNEK